jgi:excinuclease ABC subunit C
LSTVNTYYGELEPVIRALPPKPGIYQFFDRDGNLIYVGKAKNLKKRVTSYFSKESSLGGKLLVLVRKIARIEPIIVPTEFDALLLENNLIKKHQPRYNILLKDDKTYPWICLKNEPFPRIFPTRNPVKDGSEYFGPYASGRMMHTLLELIRQLYPLRTCSLNLTSQNIEKHRFKACLEFHIGNCKAPCEGLQTAEDYAASIASIRNIIRGNLATVVQQLKELMHRLSAELEFERAQVVKEKYELLLRYQSKSTVVNPRIDHVDVFSYIPEEQAVFVNYVKVISGMMVQSHTVEIQKKLDESPEELLTHAVMDIRQRFESDAGEIIVPFDPGFGMPGCVFTVPKKGDKKQLLVLSEQNARSYKLELEKQKDLTDPERHTRRIMARAMADLRMKEEPRHIECFDNSNIQGEQAVAAMVCFRDGKPDKKNYRHFNIRTVAGPDDYASMEEVVYRRYKRQVEEGQQLPQLIVIDGGKGQLNAALHSLDKLGLRDRIAVIGIAKRLEEIYYPDDPLPLYLDKKSETLRLIQHIRDEAHRFGITHHKKKREKETLKTSLTDLEGIGPTTAQKVLLKFRSVKNLGAATLEELQQVAGKAKGKLVYDHFRKAKP